jgi:hypothetical protein
MKIKASNQLNLIILSLALILLTSCATTPRAGIVTGTLVSASGDPLPLEYSVVLCKVVSNASDCTPKEQYQSVTANGFFSIKNAPVGNYALIITPVTSDFAELIMRGDSGKALVITLEEGKDFNLGTVTLRQP